MFADIAVDALGVTAFGEKKPDRAEFAHRGESASEESAKAVVQSLINMLVKKGNAWVYERWSLRLV